jgi:hypothetical protein
MNGSQEARMIALRPCQNGGATATLCAGSKRLVVRRLRPGPRLPIVLARPRSLLFVRVVSVVGLLCCVPRRVMPGAGGCSTGANWVTVDLSFVDAFGPIGVAGETKTCEKDV